MPGEDLGIKAWTYEDTETASTSARVFIIATGLYTVLAFLLYPAGALLKQLNLRVQEMRSQEY
jgi:hypothetical protein